MTQEYLLPPDTKEELAALKAWLKKNGKHSLMDLRKEMGDDCCLEI